MRYLLIALLAGLAMVSCRKTPGCTSPKALNYNYEADEDDGTCYYTTTTFYAKYGYYSGIPITNIDVSVDGSYIGSLSVIYPSGPGNCSASGTTAYEHVDGESHDWNATVYLATGATLYGSGTISASSSQECKKINVTN